MSLLLGILCEHYVAVLCRNQVFHRIFKYCITAFKVLYLGAQMCYANAATIDATTHRVLAPPLTEV